MAITDKLRHYIEGAEQLYGRKCPCLTAVADRIDEAHDRAIASVMNDALYHANDKDMAELGWVRLPKGADSEYIHVGDELRDEWNELNRGEVEWLMLDCHGWWLKFKNNCERFYLHEFHEWHHHHAPTVEDVLRDMHAKLNEVIALYVGEAIDSDERDSDEARIFAEYAAKLRLRGDAE